MMQRARDDEANTRRAGRGDRAAAHDWGGTPLSTSAGIDMSDKPVVLFAWIHNSGRSVAARILTEHYANGAVEARSAGLAPKD
jgi:hypothetical protein